MIKVLFFAHLAELAGQNATQVEYESDCTPRSVVQSLVGEMPKALTDALIHDYALVAANQNMIAWDDPLADGDELAFLPPFSGG